jgi:hydrogenase small subunit
MAITRREFVSTLGMLAAAVGMSQGDLAKVTEAFGHASPAAAPGLWGGNWTDKPKVVWVHGAECTGCSTSLLSLFEDASGVAVPGTALGDVTTVQALAVVGGLGVLSTANAVAQIDDPITTVGREHPSGHRTLNVNHLNVDGSAYAVNIADVLIDFIDLQYHETVMGMGGDAAYAYLRNQMDTDAGAFVLVVEGAVQDFAGGGYWSKPGSASSVPWCSIAKNGQPGAATNATNELSFDDVVETLASKGACKAVVAIGQCATFGGYPACIGPDLAPKASGTKSQTGAKGVYDFLVARGNAAKDKVINVPGCPANPWWFTLTVVAWLVDAVTATPTSNGVLGILDGGLNIVGGVDSSRRLTAVYGSLLHGKYCPRYPDYAARRFVSKPGEFVVGSVGGGCLKNIGCKGLSTMASCGRHGWNNAQPENVTLNADAGSTTKPAQIPPLYPSTDVATKIGGCCLTAGAPCMGCTEKGYPDAFTPFVVR